jgi:serine/threonine protein kinase
MSADVLGAGSFSTVYRCVHRETKAEFAVKVVEKTFEKSNARNTMK